jgi:hypothetical protein
MHLRNSHLAAAIHKAGGPLRAATSPLFNNPALRVIERVLGGFGLNLRNLKTALSVFAFLLVLGLPLLLMVRRELWLQDSAAD